MKTLSKIAAGAVALGLIAATPAAAQNYRDRDRGNDTTRDALLGAAVGAVAGGLIGQGDGRYIAGGAVAGAALGLGQSNSRDNCDYYRGGRCYRNQGHWEREHGINSRDPRWEQRRDYRENRRERRRDRDYRYDRRW